MRYELAADVSGDMDDIPVLGHSAFNLKEKPLVSCRPGDFLKLQVDKRVLLPEGGAGGLNVGSSHINNGTELPLGLGLGHNLIMVRVENIALGLGFLPRLEQRRAGRCGKRDTPKEHDEHDYRP